MFRTLLTLLFTALGSQLLGAAIVISEIDSDQTAADDHEFIELYSTTSRATSLDGLSLVLFNGNGDTAYRVIDLDGFSTNSDGVFIIGSATVLNVDLIRFTTDGLQNGADAVALYFGDFTTGAAPTTDNLIHALVYGTGDPDDVGLLAALGETVQVDENLNGDRETESITNIHGVWQLAAPSPGVSHVPEPTVLLLAVLGGLGIARRRRGS